MLTKRFGGGTWSAAVIALSGILAAGAASGQLVDWVGGDSVYDDPGAWSTSIVPGIGSDLRFAQPSPSTVRWSTATPAATVSSMLVADETGADRQVTLRSTRDASGPDLRLSGANADGFGLDVRFGEVLTLGVSGMPSENVFLQVERDARVDTQATLNVTGGSRLERPSVAGFAIPDFLVSGAALNVSEESIFDAGELRVDVSSAAAFSSSNVRIDSGALARLEGLTVLGNRGGRDSSVSVTDAGSRLIVDSAGEDIRIDAQESNSDARLTVSAGATLSAEDVTVDATGSASALASFDVAGTGSTASLSTLSLGGSSKGRTAFRVLDGATADVGADLKIGPGAIVDVDGVGSGFEARDLLTLAPGVPEKTGQEARFRVTNGATASFDPTTGRTEVGGLGTIGELLVRDAGSLLTFEGDAAVTGNQSEARVQNGGELRAAGLLLRDRATLAVAEGAVVVETLDLGDGRLDFSSGSIDVTSAAASLRVGPGLGLPSLNAQRTLSNAGATLIEPGATVRVEAGGAFSSGLIVNEGVVELVKASGATADYVQDLASGPAGSYRGAGTLRVDDGVTARFRNFGPVALGSETMLNGGRIDAGSNGVVLPAGAMLQGSGSVSGAFFGQLGSQLGVTGDLTLGQTSLLAGFAMEGTILTLQDSTLTIQTGNRASLGLQTALAGGSTLTAANGLVVDFGERVTSFLGSPTISVGADATRSFINNGRVSGESAFDPLVLEGFVQGVGTFEDIVFNGTFAPGLSPAAVTLGAATYAGSLEIELGGTNPGSDYDQVNHTLGAGTAALGGVLDVVLLPGFTPEDGDAFTILTASNGLSGAFGTVDLPGLMEGLQWDLRQTANALELAVIASGLLGDYNGNGVVDAADYTVWADNFGSTSTLAADGNGNGVVDAADYTIWADNFGTSAAVSQGLVNVPEPQAMLLLGAGLLAAGRRKRRPV
ncbi:MAG: PEP-CTERM sorting domain-containing protein [Planctomycetota bacterium]